MTTAQAILCGFALVALAIASLPYLSSVVSPSPPLPAQDNRQKVQKIAICNSSGRHCADILTKPRYGNTMYLGISY